MSLTKVSYSMINGPTVNILDMGFTNTLGSDIYAAFVLALSNVQAGGVIDFRSVNVSCVCSGAITITKPITILWGAATVAFQTSPGVTIGASGAGTQIFGMGQTSTWNTQATSNFNILYLNATSNVRVSDMNFTGNAVGTDPSTPVRGIYAFQSSYVEIDSNTFDNLNYHIHLSDNTVNVNNNNHFSIHDNYFLSAPGLTNGGYGVLLTRCSRNSVTDNILSGPFDRHAIYVSAGTRGTVIQGNNVGNSNLASVSFFVQAAADEIYDIVVDGNNLKGDGILASFSHGISITGQVRNTVITSNIITNCGSYGINVQPASTTLRPSELLISNNTVYANQKIGMYLAGITGCVVSNNNLSGNGIDGVSETDIDVDELFAYASTTNSFVGNITNSGMYQGIRLNSTSSGNYVSNTIGNTTRQLVLDNSANANFLDQNRTGIQSPTSSAGVLNINAAAGSLLKVTLTESVTVTINNYPYASLPGGVLEFVFTQDSTGGRTVAFSSSFKTAWSDTGNTANKVSSIRFVFDGTYYQQIGAQMTYH
jgi:parallel beta-helix repeat protein